MTDKFREDKDKEMDDDKSFSAPTDANALCGQFDDVNGDFDTPREFIRAYLAKDPRALKMLETQDFHQLKAILDKEYPELREYLVDGVITPDEMREILDKVHKIEAPSK